MIFFKLSIVLILLNGDVQVLKGHDFAKRNECISFMYRLNTNLVKRLKGKVYKIDLSCAETRTA